MNGKYFSVVTNVGLQEIIKAMNEEKKLEITHFAVGDSNGRYAVPSVEMTMLRNEVWRGEIKCCEKSPDSQTGLLISAIIPENIGGFTIREMGVFSDDVLIAVCNTPDSEKAGEGEGVLHEMDLCMEIELINNDAIELMVDGNVIFVTKKELEVFGEKIDKELNLKADKTITKNITLEAAGWTGNEPPYSYTISLEEVTADNNIEVTYPVAPTQEVYEQLTSAGLCGGSQTAGSMTLLAYGDKPVMDLPVTVFIKGD